MFSFADFAESVQTHYAEQDAAALRRMLEQAEGRREAVFLCRFRLYPLTRDEADLGELPHEAEDASARTLALLSGLWGYRTAEASIFKLLTVGRRAQRLLDEAREMDPVNPYVLFVEGQSLLFRPSFAGGDRELALRRFRQLESVLENHERTGISETEARVWIWRALLELDDPEAAPLRAELLEQDLPPLYRAFLESPPRFG